MNKKIAFIICFNNELILNECISYINLLNKPDDYSIDIITIKEAPYITAGYNAGMLESDAKYKIYMHQDVFIINRNFYFDFLSIFESNPEIGLIGMVGYDLVSPTGQMWHTPRYGTVSMFGSGTFPNSNYTSQALHNYAYSLHTDGYTEVSLIDGLMMITQYDLVWDEDILKDWDFYDAFQSINFLENHYKIVVPNQVVPWFIHNDGYYLSMFNYNKYRRIFIKKYMKYLGLTSKEIRELIQ